MGTQTPSKVVLTENSCLALPCHVTKGDESRTRDHYLSNAVVYTPARSASNVSTAVMVERETGVEPGNFPLAGISSLALCGGDHGCHHSVSS